jgi:hypothetical protein
VSSDYGSAAGTAKYVRHMTASGSFTTGTKPTLVEVTEMLDESCAVLNGWLAENGYTVPVTATRAVSALARYANLGAAGLAELAQRSAGYSETDQNRRENKFLAEFNKAEAFIASGALGGLGAATTDEPPALSGFSVGGLTVGGQRLRPIFRRNSFGNDPTAESPPTREPDYTGDI